MLTRRAFVATATTAATMPSIALNNLLSPHTQAIHVMVESVQELMELEALRVRAHGVCPVEVMQEWDLPISWYQDRHDFEAVGELIEQALVGVQGSWQQWLKQNHACIPSDQCTRDNFYYRLRMHLPMTDRQYVQPKVQEAFAVSLVSH